MGSQHLKMFVLSDTLNATGESDNNKSLFFTYDPKTKRIYMHWKGPTSYPWDCVPSLGCGKSNY